MVILGPSDSGKSTLLHKQLITPMFGADWVIGGDRCSEAGLRQSIGHDSQPLILDEFDDYPDRPKVMQLLRTASQGSFVTERHHESSKL